MHAPATKNAAKRKGIAVLPHEWCFGFFLALTGLRLLIKGGEATAWSAVFLGFVIGSVFVIAWAARNPTPLRWRLRLLFYPLAMGVTFYTMRWAVPALGNPKIDSMLLAWDRALFGETPAIAWEKYLYPWLEDIAMIGYNFFFFYLVLGPAYYCIRNLPLFRKCIVGLFTMYGIGFLGYTFFPAGGPHRWMTFETPLHGPWVLDWTLRTVNDGSNCVDVFPSIHFAAMLYLLMFDWQHQRRHFWWALVPCIVMWFATLYLRFHYAVDLLAGLLVTTVAWFTARWYERSALAQRISEEEVVSRRPPVHGEFVEAETNTVKEL